MRISIILYENCKREYLEQKVNKLVHLAKLQRVILISCLKRYEDIFNGYIGELTGPPLDIPPKYEAKPCHAQYFPILVIHQEAFKNIWID